MSVVCEGGGVLRREKREKEVLPAKAEGRESTETRTSPPLFFLLLLSARFPPPLGLWPNGAWRRRRIELEAPSMLLRPVDGSR